MKKRVSARPPAGGRGAPAGDPVRDLVAQQGGEVETAVIVANERDKRALAWLREQAGDAAICDALGRLAGARKPYVSNIAKILGLTIPESTEVADDETARRYLDNIRKILRQ